MGRRCWSTCLYLVIVICGQALVQADEFCFTGANWTARCPGNETDIDENVDVFVDINGTAPPQQLTVLRVIRLQGLFELTNAGCREDPRDGLSELEATRLAIQHVNEYNVVPGYQFVVHYNDTQCDAGVAVNAFFQSIYRLPTITVLLGPIYSDTTERLARVVNFWNVVQISFGARSPALSDQKNYPLFYRTAAPDISHNSARVSFIRHFQWDTVATIFEDVDEYTLPINELISDLEEANLSVSATKSVTEQDYKEHLGELKVKDCRIIIGSFSDFLLKKIFCEVYRLGMFGADYVWLLTEPQKDWWLNASDTSCGVSELAQAAEGFFTVSSYNATTGNHTSVSGMTTEDFLTIIGHRAKWTSPFVTHAYDAVWTIALTFQQAVKQWTAQNKSFSLEDFNYIRNDMAQTFSSLIEKLRFEGVSGPVSFRGADRIGTTTFYQNQDGEMKRVALYHPEIANLEFDCSSCSPLLWKGNEVPIARRIFKLRIATVHNTVFVIIATLASLGMAMAVFFLAFNLHYHRLKYIKLSSPNLNNIAVVGCLLVYVGVVLLGLDFATLKNNDQYRVVCTARAFLFSGGFSLAFGSMFIKTYRVHHIFIRTNSGIIRSKLLQDQQLIAMVGALVLIDWVIVTVWVTVDPMERYLMNLTAQASKVERNVVYMMQREQCQSTHMAKWLGVLYVYKGLLLAVGCYMAWETRHVKIPALNDSQYIGMSVYNVVITSVIVVALANVISVENYVLTFLLVSALILASTTTTLCLLFVPKILTILKNPDGDAVVATYGVKVEYNTRRFLIDEQREIVYRAEVQNRVYHRELMEMNQEIARLKALLGESMTDSESDDEQDNAESSLIEKPKGISVSWDVDASDHYGAFQSNRKNLKNAKTLHSSKLYSVKKPASPCYLANYLDRERQLRGSLPAIMLPCQINLLLQSTGSYPALSPTREPVVSVHQTDCDNTLCIPSPRTLNCSADSFSECAFFSLKSDDSASQQQLTSWSEGTWGTAQSPVTPTPNNNNSSLSSSTEDNPFSEEVTSLPGDNTKTTIAIISNNQ